MASAPSATKRLMSRTRGKAKLPLSFTRSPVLQSQSKRRRPSTRMGDSDLILLPYWASTWESGSGGGGGGGGGIAVGRPRHGHSLSGSGVGAVVNAAAAALAEDAQSAAFAAAGGNPTAAAAASSSVTVGTTTSSVSTGASATVATGSSTVASGRSSVLTHGSTSHSHSTAPPHPPRHPTLAAGHSTDDTNRINWTRGQQIGEGAFSIVYLGLNQDTGELLAVKQLKREGLGRLSHHSEKSGDAMTELEEEIRVLFAFVSS